ncbi:Glycerol kinase [Lactococcus lactis]|nr:Glycerol kinase [Lactococcus lactis]
MKIIDKASDSEAAALESKNEDEIYMVPAFVGLGAPYWDQEARGAMFGLTRGTTDKDLIKATLQGIAYQVRDILGAMGEDTGIKIPILKVDGGATNNEYLMQFQADIFKYFRSKSWRFRNNGPRCSLPCRTCRWFLERL